jgi:hypothetical protein
MPWRAMAMASARPSSAVPVDQRARALARGVDGARRRSGSGARQQLWVRCKERLGRSVVVGRLVERDRDRPLPEVDGGIVAGDLVNAPGAGKLGEHRPCCANTDPAATVLPDDEELSELMRCARPDEGAAPNPIIDVDQERMPIFARKPVVVQVPVAVLTVWPEVTTVDLGEVVRVELEQPSDDRLVAFECWDHRDTHRSRLARGMLTCKAGPAPNAVTILHARGCAPPVRAARRTPAT